MTTEFDNLTNEEKERFFDKMDQEVIQEPANKEYYEPMFPMSNHSSKMDSVVVGRFDPETNAARVIEPIKTKINAKPKPKPKPKPTASAVKEKKTKVASTRKQLIKKFMPKPRKGGGQRKTHKKKRVHFK